MAEPPLEDILRHLGELHPASAPSVQAKATLEVRLARELFGVIRELTGAINASTREAGTLNRRLIFLNWALVVLTVLLVVLGVIGLRGHN